MKQGTIIKATSDFTMRKQGARGRAMLVRTNDIFIITSPDYNNKEASLVDRYKSASLNQGYMLANSDIEKLFVVVD